MNIIDNNYRFSLIREKMRQENSSHLRHKSPIYSKIQKATTLYLNEKGISAIVKRQNNMQRVQKLQKTTECNVSLRNNASKMNREANSPQQIPNIRIQAKKQKAFQTSGKSNFVTVERCNQYNIKPKTNLTQIIVNSNRSSQIEKQKFPQSKSPLKKKKYCLTQQSYLPTSSSSTYNLDEDKKSNQNIITQYYQTRKQLNNLMQEKIDKTSSLQFPLRLKSLNYIRSKSKKKDSSIEKHMRSQAKTQKIIDFYRTATQDITQIKPQVKLKIIRIKASHFIPPEDINLKLSSKIGNNSIDRSDIAEKIELHLQLLNQLPAYVKQFKEIYEETECWQQLIFLTYKKFYIERLKVQLALSNKSIVSQYKNLMTINPFKFSCCQIDGKELYSFKNSIEALKIQTRLQQQNKEILGSLRNLYNLFILKSGRYINLYLIDNFSKQIYALMCEQVKLLQQNQYDSLENIRLQRINNIMKCCLIVGSLNGICLNIASLFTGDDCSQQLHTIFLKFMQTLKK